MIYRSREKEGTLLPWRVTLVVVPQAAQQKGREVERDVIKARQDLTQGDY